MVESGTSRSRLPEYVLAAVIGLLGVWAARFIWLTSFVLDDTRYFSLFDDALISMAYARNLVEGQGLRWGRWEAPVEGFSNPLWTGFMVLVNAVGLPLAKRSLIVQVVSGVFLMMNLRELRLLHEHHLGGRDLAWLIPVSLTALFYPLNYWSLLGMETGAQALLYTLAVRLTLDAERGVTDARWSVYVVFAALLLLRLDTAVVVGPCAAALALRTRTATPARRWLRGAAIVVGPLAAYQAFRWAYFGAVLPNTYYLKMTGVDTSIRVERGWQVLVSMVEIEWLFVAVFAASTVWLATRRRDAALLVTSIVLAAASYSVWVGGDAWDAVWSHVAVNRFIAPVMPLAFAVVGGAVSSVARAAVASGRRHLPEVVYAAGGVLAVLLAVSTNAVLSATPAEQFERALLLGERPMHVDYHEGITADVIALDAIVPAEAKVAGVWAGMLAYYTRFRAVDVLGYNDRHVARLDARFHRPTRRRSTQGT